MSSTPRGLDHVVHAVRDLEAARQAYASLGFTTTPPARHPWGTGNSLVQLDRSFFEILSVEEPGRIVPAGPGEFSFGRHNVDFLARREGMSMLVFSSDDARADGERWRAAGLASYAPFDFSRTATLPGGEQVTVAFSLCFTGSPELPGLGWFVCQQHYPEHFWKPDYQRHANGAAAMSCVWLQAREPQRHGAFLAALFPDEARLVEEEGGITLELPYGRVAVRTPGFMAERFAGAALPTDVSDPAFVAVGVDSRGVTSRRDVVHGLVVEIG